MGFTNRLVSLRVLGSMVNVYDIFGDFAMIIVHHLNNSRSHRIIWLLEELGLKYEIVTYTRSSKTRLAPATLRKIHPLGHSPVIVDGDVTLAESGAIIEYLLYNYGKDRLKPATGSPEWIQYIYWLHFAEGTLMPLLLVTAVLEGAHKNSPWILKPVVGVIKNKVKDLFINPRLTNQLTYIEATLSKTNWLAGDEFTAADIQMGIPLMWVMSYGLTTTDIPKIQNYVDQLKTRPAFIRAMKKAGPLGVAQAKE